MPLTSPPTPPPRLEQWSLTRAAPSPYAAPEQAVVRAAGRVYGHPAWPDGHPVRTTRLVAAAGRLITTRSGSVYALGEPDPDYAAWHYEATGNAPAGGDAAPAPAG